MMNLPEVGKYYPRESLVRNRSLAVEFSKVYENPWRGSYLGPKLQGSIRDSRENSLEASRKQIGLSQVKATAGLNDSAEKLNLP